jgi:septal ring factor EnvC (AmiA/AmiB activator)
MKTDTPETDSAYIQRPNEGAWDFRVRQEKTMETLERERDEAREELTAVTEQRDEALSDLEFRRDLYRLQTKTLDDVREQRDRLAELLRKLDMTLEAQCFSPTGYTRTEIHEALAAVEGGSDELQG